MRKISVFCEKSGKNEQKKGFFAEVDKELPIFICWCANRNTVYTVTKVVERYPFLSYIKQAVAKVTAFLVKKI